MRVSFWLHLILLLATAYAGPALADTDPSLTQVYEAVRTGHVEQAQKMMNQVLHDHPKSAKAHYVAAEVNAASGNFVQGRQELRLAQELAPGVPFAAPESVRELQDKLSRTPSLHAPAARQTGAGFLWSVLVVVVIGVGVVLALVSMRRRVPANQSYAQPSEVGPPPAAGLPAIATPAGIPSSAGTGIGPSIAGDLAGGLAAGAGIVAGEEIARHLLISGEHEVNSPPVGEIPQEQHESDRLGGPDFGVSDASSWEDDDRASGGDDWA
jgi:uncharacterized protein